MKAMVINAARVNGINIFVFMLNARKINNAAISNWQERSHVRLVLYISTAGLHSILIAQGRYRILVSPIN